MPTNYSAMAEFKIEKKRQGDGVEEGCKPDSFDDALTDQSTFLPEFGDVRRSVTSAVVASDRCKQSTAGAGSTLAQPLMEVVVGSIVKALPIIADPRRRDCAQVVANGVKRNRPPEWNLCAKSERIGGVIAVMAGVGKLLLLEKGIEGVLEVAMHRAANPVTKRHHFLQHCKASICVVDIISVTDQRIVVGSGVEELIEALPRMDAGEGVKAQIGALLAVVATDSASEISGAAIENHDIDGTTGFGAGSGNETGQSLREGFRRIERRNKKA